jgi:hypothetical protein
MSRIAHPAIVSRAKRARAAIWRFKASVSAELAPRFRAFLLPLGGFGPPRRRRQQPRSAMTALRRLRPSAVRKYRSFRAGFANGPIRPKAPSAKPADIGRIQTGGFRRSSANSGRSLNASHTVGSAGADIRRGRLNVANRRILLKNSEIEGRRKSRIRAHSVVYASRCHSKAYERVARSKAGRSAEPLRKFPLRLPAVF